MVAESLNGSEYGCEAIERHLFQSDVHRSSICRAKAKLSRAVFEGLLTNLSDANESRTLWHGHRVRGGDGSYFTLPAHPGVTASFPVHRPHKEHYPKGLCFAAVNVFTGQPIAVGLEAYNTSEHSQLIKMLDQFKPGDIMLLDRYFHSRDIFLEFTRREQFFIVRAKIYDGSSSLSSQLKKSGKKDLTIDMQYEGKSMKLRLLEVGSKSHRVVLITNLLNKRRYTYAEIKRLYKLRWAAETFFLRIKQYLGAQRWHAKSAHGVRLEIMAHCLALSLMAAQVFLATVKKQLKSDIKINFRAAKLIFCSCLIRPVSKSTLLNLLRKCIVHHQSGRSYPRQSFQPTNRWIGRRTATAAWKNKANRKKGYWKHAR